MNISSYQTILLITIYRAIMSLTYLPVVNTPPGNQDVWIMILLSIPYTIVFCFPILFLSNKFNDLTIIEYTEKIMGKVLGKIMGFIYAMILLIFNIFTVGILVEGLNTMMFPETPTWVTASIMLITCAYVAYKGLEPMARGAEIFVPFILIVVLIFIILGYQNYDFTVLLPILSDSKFKDINKGAMYTAFRFLDIIILAMIAPYLNNKEDLNKIFIQSVIYSLSIILLVTIVTQVSLGIEFAKYSNFPFFTFTRLINILDFIQRIDALYIVSWIVGNIGKITGYLYFSALAFNQVFKKGDHKNYIIPITLIILIAVILIKDKKSILGIKGLIEDIILVMSILSIGILPIITFMIYFFRRKTINKEGD
ncbi:spore germination protein KB [Keratinibaculum paraultunense]|uniref:Spore germination protein KB n=1 Tax=Keratinibaculum paraultunense TaxID=1278232 RepID=A0A4R3KY14_9FIRM|nr:endospore germination permease [Keratinibaculum paraultunense]QQY80338.1 endospore germination permease [Keratinibaculum paraultunense]TCS90860.1 spore germination protein KB [Keratinibaculum paraultunense]